MKPTKTTLPLLSTLLMAFLIFTIFATGCSDNPVAPSADDQTNQGNQPPVASGSIKLYGSIAYSLATDAEAQTITLTNRGTNETQAVTSANSYFFDGLSEGYYSLEIAESTKNYANSHYFYLEANLELNLFRVSKSNTANTTINLFGTVNEAAHESSVHYATVTAKNTTTNAEYNATTINDGSFYFLGLASGTYELTFKAASYANVTKTLNILDNKIVYQSKNIDLSDTAGFNDVSGNALTGYNLGKNNLSPSILTTGTLMGMLTDSNGDPIVAGTPLVLLYDDNLGDQRRPTKIYDFKMKSNNGYFTASSLPPGYYAVAHKTYTLTEVKNSLGDIVGYAITSGGVMNTFLKVDSGKVTTLPKVE